MGKYDSLLYERPKRLRFTLPWMLFSMGFAMTFIIFGLFVIPIKDADTIRIFSILLIGGGVIAPLLFAVSQYADHRLKQFMAASDKLQGKVNWVTDRYWLGIFRRASARFNIQVQMPTGETRDFMSKKISNRVRYTVVDYKLIDTFVDVYVRRDDPTKYYVDIESITEYDEKRRLQIVRKMLEQG